jgi:Fur family ferric uptake transcriptional regulator
VIEQSHLANNAIAAERTADSAARIAANGGRATRTRVAVLDILSSAGRPLAHDEVGEALTQLGIDHDRVTLYRTLDWLVTHALAHRVAGADRSWRFNAAADEAHGHAHFHCSRCGGVYCLESLQPAFAATLPAGFRMERADLSFHGRCPNCH